MADPASRIRLRLSCPDPRATADFLERALGFERTSPNTLTCGQQPVELVPGKAGAAPVAVLVPCNDLAFQHFAIATHDIEAAHTRLRSAGGWTPISLDGPVLLPERSGGACAFKFRNPDGHPLELIQFPHGNAKRIDHTAICVSDTARSIAFYRRFGFEPGRTNLNHGSEQDTLDGLTGVRVEVTPLARPASGAPHLELLCYRSPEPVATGVADGSPLATVTVIDPDGAALLDPDGHRLVARIPEPNP